MRRGGNDYQLTRPNLHLDYGAFFKSGRLRKSGRYSDRQAIAPF